MCQNCEIVLFHSRYIRQFTLIHPCCHSCYFPTILFFGLLPTITSYNFVLWIIVNHSIHTILCVGLLLTISFILFFDPSLIIAATSMEKCRLALHMCAPCSGVISDRILFSLYHYSTWAYGAMSFMVLLCHLLGLQIANNSTNLKISLILGVINADCNATGSSPLCISANSSGVCFG